MVLSWLVILGLKLAAFSICVYGNDSDNVKDLYLIGLFPLSGPWDGGQGIMPAAEMAIEDINNRSDILPGYRLNMISNNTGCHPGLGSKALADNVYTPPTKILIIGPGCSTVSEVVAQTAHLYNLIQISPVSISSALSRTKKFPNFFRIVAPERVLNEARMVLLKYFNWTRVATIYEDYGIFSTMMEDLLKRLEEEHYVIAEKTSFSDQNPQSAIQTLKEADARIIVGGFYPDTARRVFCAVYNQRFYGKHVWLTTGALAHDDHWWKVPDKDINCTSQQIEEALNGTIIIQNVYSTRNANEEGIPTKMSLERFQKIFNERTKNMSQPVSGADRAPVGYDTVWAAAIALNKTMNNLTESGSQKTLANFTYEDSEMTELMKAKVHEVRFKSVSGNVAFKKNGDGVRLVSINMIRAGKFEKIAWYDNTKPEGQKLEIVFQQKGGFPKDRKETKRIPETISVTIYVIMTSISGLGIVLAICFLLFNISRRNVKIIKLSSPNINNIILLGCILAYLSVFIEDITSTRDTLSCKAKVVLVLLAFSLSFGALFAKTWRVYSVFTASFQHKRRHIKDHTLYLMIAGMVCLNALILCAWFSIDAWTIDAKDIDDKIDKQEDDVFIQYFYDYCTSSKQNYFIGTILIIQGLFLFLGVFLAWETRKVKFSSLNESRYIGMCIYNVVVLGCISVLVSLSLTNSITIMYVINSSITIISTTVIQCLLFVPKILAYRNFLQGKLNDLGSTNTSEQNVQIFDLTKTKGTQTDTTNSDVVEELENLITEQ